MKKDAYDLRVTESVDALMPGAGEIIRGSLRIDNYEELMAVSKRIKIALDDYYWYIDQRRYGSSPHGGYGLGLERFMAWIAHQHTVRTCGIYPRFTGIWKP
ncbi:asparagine--tRNA ligase, cytoplasmic [Xylaria scruposa]|nr:asparagine--tRNA ligase, cytoplasmic [Xylaria scruposa]